MNATVLNLLQFSSRPDCGFVSAFVSDKVPLYATNYRKSYEMFILSVRKIAFHTPAAWFVVGKSWH
jgi:hypothetical protein